jgi:methyl-accepting chemotaxis protein
VGLLVALLGLGTLLWTANTVTSFNARVGDESEELGATLRGTARALDDASRTAESFEATLERTPPSVRQAAQTIRNLRPRLVALQAQAGAIDIFGTRPLGSIGELFGQMAVDLEGLDNQLDLIADSLGGNQESLRTNARSLAALADELTGFADRLDDGLVADSLGEVRTILALVLALLVVAMAVPAAGSLALGVWLRRELGIGRAAPSLIVVER